MSKSTVPEYPWLLVLPCIVIALAPASWHILATSGALILLLSQPLLILTVTGTFTALTTDETISFILEGFFI